MTIVPEVNDAVEGWVDCGNLRVPGKDENMPGGGARPIPQFGLQRHPKRRNSDPRFFLFFSFVRLLFKSFSHPFKCHRVDLFGRRVFTGCLVLRVWKI
jgi:hypothetical protein